MKQQEQHGHQAKMVSTATTKRPSILTKLVLTVLGLSFAVAALAAGSQPEYDPFTQDPQVQDKKFPPMVREVTFDSHGVKLYGKIFSAQGKGAHPTLLIARGFPDMTSSADIALLAQRAGYNAMIFNYRGAWGMRGEFSLENSYQDLLAAVAYLRSYPVSQGMHVDPNNIVLYGYSLGGPIVLRLAATDSNIRGVLQLDGLDMRNFQSLSSEQRSNWERGFDTPAIPTANGKEIVTGIISQFNSAWDPASYAKGLADKDILLLWAKQGNGHLAQIKERPSLQALYTPHSRVTEKTLDTDHDFSDSRIALGKVTLAWLKQISFVASSFTEKKVPSEEKTISLPITELKKYAGTYQRGSFPKTFIKVDGDKLVEADGDQLWQPVMALANDKFFVDDKKIPGCQDVKFNKDNKGTVVSLTVECSGRSLTIPRVSQDLLLPKETANIELGDAMLAEYSGKYLISASPGEPERFLEISVSGKNLGAQPDGDVKDILYAEAADKFFSKRLEFSFEFLRNAQGQVSELRATLNTGKVIHLIKKF